MNGQSKSRTPGRDGRWDEWLIDERHRILCERRTETTQQASKYERTEPVANRAGVPRTARATSSGNPCEMLGGHDIG